MDTLRKWLNKPKADDRSLLARFYHADRALTAVSSELDSFDGRAEPERCSRLVGRLRQGQDRVLGITNQIMDELLCDDRAPRAFRAKFPEEVLQESLAGQLWFGAECLAAGSSIMNREMESAAMRPLAKAVTKSLNNVRNLLREQCLRNNTPNSLTLNLDINDAGTENLYESLKIFDKLFAEFELLYVSAMVPVKSQQEHQMQELICVLFSETLRRALRICLLEQEQVDTFDPSLMFSIPRLAIIVGLVIYDRGPLNMDMPTEQLSELFRPFRTLLVKIRDLLRTLTKNELYQLEKLLCTNEEIHLKRDFICDDDKMMHSDDDLVTNMINSDCCATNNKDLLPNFYSTNDADVEAAHTNWVDDTKDSLVNNADCVSGFLIPNTNFGNLLQTNDDDDETGPMTDDSHYTSSDESEEAARDTTIAGGRPIVAGAETANHVAHSQSGGDSGIGTENTSLDRTPESDVAATATVTAAVAHEAKMKNAITKQSSVHGVNGVHGGGISRANQYSENWANLERTQPGCSRNPTDSSDENDNKRETATVVVVAGTSHLRTRTTRSGADRTHRKSSKTLRNQQSAFSAKRRTKSAMDTSSDSSSTQSEGDPQEVALALRAAGRMRFKSTENLLHRLFVCIAGVADQLQTNFASDLRQILRSVFLMNTSPAEEESEPEPVAEAKQTKESDLFEFRASESDVIQETNNGGSNQSIYSAAEEVNPEVDCVFANGTTSGSGSQNSNRSASEEHECIENVMVAATIRGSIERSRSLGDHPNEEHDNKQNNNTAANNNVSIRIRGKDTCAHQTQSANGSPTMSIGDDEDNGNRYYRPPANGGGGCAGRRRVRSSSEASSTATVATNTSPPPHQPHSPPRWIPDEEAPRCMACTVPFTAFRRRHHCRNCGGVFCGGCSNSTAPLPKFGLTKAVRVCRECFMRECSSAVVCN